MSVARAKIEQLLSTYAFGSLVKDGVRVLLCGRPNSGKSSLLNLLLGKKKAIVSDVSGTTRDLIEDEASLAGHKFIFCDSAGLRDTTDEIEKIGVELAKERIPWADLVLFLVDATDAAGEWKDALRILADHDKKVWMVINKIDLNSQALSRIYCDSTQCQQNFFISAKTGAGIGPLIEALVEDVAKRLPERGEVGEVVTNERHRECLLRSSAALGRCLDGMHIGGIPLSILASDIKEALDALDEIVGKTYTEDILGRIFSKFCIGK